MVARKTHRRSLALGFLVVLLIASPFAYLFIRRVQTHQANVRFAQEFTSSLPKGSVSQDLEAVIALRRDVNAGQALGSSGISRIYRAIDANHHDASGGTGWLATSIGFDALAKDLSFEDSLHKDEIYRAARERLNTPSFTRTADDVSGLQRILNHRKDHSAQANNAQVPSSG